jgi:isopentenyl-diphosphate delta-isomerase
MPDVVLVDLVDRPLGVASKAEAHERGLLHRAFSVFLFDRDDRLILQRRAEGKYHSGGKWTNTCCSHPGYGERVLEAAHRRLHEELALDEPVELLPVGSFVYRHRFEDGVTEYEFDHVLVGRCPTVETLRPDPAEVSQVTSVSLGDLATALVERPDDFTVWLPEATSLVMAWDEKHRVASLA